MLTRKRLFATLLIAILALANIGASSLPAQTLVPLYGRYVVPANDSDGTGMFAITSHSDSKDFNLCVSNISNVNNATSVHIYEGDPGENGTPILELCSGPTCMSLTDQTMGVSGTITDPDVLELMDDEKTYIMIRTQAYPDGEIRGHITGNIFSFTF